MALPIALLSLLQSKSLWYALGMMAVVSVIFVGGCNYGASGKKQIQAEFDAYKKEQAILILQVTAANAKNAIAANDRLKAEERNLEERHRKHKAELATMRTKLEAVKLELSLVQLFNDSTIANETGEPFTGPDQQEDGILDENPNSDPGIATLADLIEVTLENNKNHLACIAQVKEWQLFYRDLYKEFEPSQ
jgi:hypothetical protein